MFQTFGSNRFTICQCVWFYFAVVYIDNYTVLFVDSFFCRYIYLSLTFASEHNKKEIKRS